MDYRILGPLEAWTGERQLPLGGPRQRALLAILLLRANEAVSTDRLIDELWGERPPATAANTVQVYVSQLRKTLEARDAIETRAPGYAVRVRPGELDLHRFEELAGRGRRALAGGRAGEAAEALRAALELWRGPALADLAFEAFAGAAVLRLEELRLAALEERLEADLALGRHTELVPELEAIVAEHPLRERARGQLMLALYRAGRQADALDAFQEARRTLVDELGIEPGPALKQLERAILTHDASLELPAATGGTPLRAVADSRIVLALPRSDAGAAGLLALAAPLARSQAGRELIAVRLVAPEDEAALAAATAALREQRAALERTGVDARVAAFTSRDPARDVARLADRQEVDLLLVDLQGSELPTRSPRSCATAAVRTAPGRCWSPSEAPRTTGLRSSSAPGWPERWAPSYGWRARPGRRPASGTRAGSWPTRRSSSSSSRAWRPSRCSSRRARTASRLPPLTRRCSSSGSRIAGTARASAPFAPRSSIVLRRRC